MLTALRREPAQRYPSAAALVDDLERNLAGEPVGARTDGRACHLRKFVGRRRAPPDASKPIGHAIRKVAPACGVGATTLLAMVPPASA